MSGTITREYTVWCGTCPQWATEAWERTAVGAAKAFKRMGWRKTRQHGWQCPACVKT